MTNLFKAENLNILDKAIPSSNPQAKILANSLCAIIDGYLEGRIPIDDFTGDIKVLFGSK